MGTKSPPVNNLQIVSPPTDPNTPEGVQYLLGRAYSDNDNKLPELASEIWGDGYLHSEIVPGLLRNQLIGFLLDQEELFKIIEQVSQYQPMVPHAPMPSDPLLNGSAATVTQSSGETSLSAESQPAPSKNSPNEASSKKSGKDSSEPTN